MQVLTPFLLQFCQTPQLLFNPSRSSSNSIHYGWHILLFIFPPHVLIHALIKHISMVSNTTVSCNTKSWATHTLNQLCSQDSGAIKEPGTVPFKSYVLCSQSQTLPTSESTGTLSFLPCATLWTILQSAQVLRRQLLLARSFKFQAPASPASKSIKSFCV